MSVPASAEQDLFYLPDLARLNPFDLNPEDRVAIFTAHPDDMEMMMLYGALATFAAEKTALFIATDGEASTEGNAALIRQGKRRDEAFEAAEYIGIDEADIYMPGLPDGKLDTSAVFPDLCDEATDFIVANDISVALTLGPDGGDRRHTDHIAVHDAVLETDIATIWSANAHDQGEVHIGSNRTLLRQKLSALAIHKTQFEMERAKPRALTPINRTLYRGFLMPRRTAKLLQDDYAHFLRAETYDLARPEQPHLHAVY